MMIKGVKISKRGNSYFFRIPMAYVSNEELSLKKFYDIEIYES
jgi:antitoxin component of MazEF toxin-antitoxin module